MTDRELMQQALEALEWHLEKGAWGADIEGVAAALRERLAQPQRTHWEGCEEVHPECRKPERPPNCGTSYCSCIECVMEQPEQEPVAWRTFDGEGGYDYRTYDMNENYAEEWAKRNPRHVGWVEPLYTTPPRREWVGLTEEEVYPLANAHLRYQPESYSVSGIYDLARTIEAKLKEKNG